MITTVLWAQLFNTGNYENVRLEATSPFSTVAVMAAFALAKGAVQGQYAAFVAEREAAEQRRREEWQAQQAQERAEREARRAAATATIPAKAQAINEPSDDGDLAF